MKRWIWIPPLGLLLAVGAWYVIRGGAATEGSQRRVRVVRGTVTRNATAVGRIEAEHEVPVKSLTGGILTRLFVKLGQEVEEGDPLAEVRPVRTTMTVVEAERALEAARDGEASAREYLEGKHLAALFTRMMLGQKNLERMYRSAALAQRQTEEQIKLLREGKVSVDERAIDYLVRAPVAGHVVEITPREGAPVVPSSSYGSGTVLMTLADMGRPIFRGTVDEIDVGRLKEGMSARITIGALPGETVTGRLTEIALKATVRDNAVLFDVRIDVEAPPSGTLRLGYSAVAQIEVDRRENVLVVPERVVEFRGGEAFVQVPDNGQGRRERAVETGLSDGLTVEVVKGLAEGDEVLERVYE